MDLARLAENPEGVLLAGIGPITVGTVWLLGGKSLQGRRGQSWAWALFVALLLGVGGAFVLGQPPERWLPVLIFAGIWGAALLLRTEYVVYLSQSLRLLARQQLVQSLALIAVGAGLIISFSVRASSPIDPLPDRQETFFYGANPEWAPISLLAQTDTGRDLPLHMPLSPRNDHDLAQAEDRFYAKTNLSLRAVRTAPPSQETNSHGWIFTGGLCWLGSEQVEYILLENGYVEVPAPASDDLIVYRDRDGSIVHTGIVRAVLSDGRVLIESKWGMGGRFVHEPGTITSPADWQYYRTSRGSHLLRHLGPSSGSSPLPRLSMKMPSRLRS